MTSEDSDAFAQRVEEIVKCGTTTVGFSIGVQLGLFDHMAKFGDKIFSPKDLAQSAHCKQGYVKDWLLMMAAADIVVLCDEAGQRFQLPAHRRDVVTSTHCSISSRAKYVTMYASQVTDLVECIKIEGPNKIEDKTRALRKSERYSSLACQTPGIITQVPGLQAVLDSGAKILEVGSSSGELLLFLAQKYPKSNFTGVDPNKEGTEKAVQVAKEQGLKNVIFLMEDGTNLPEDWTEKFDYVIAINTLHHLPNGVKGAKEMKKVLKEGSYCSIIEHKKFENAQENIKQIGATTYYLFNIAVTAGGHHHHHGNHGHGHDVNQGHGKQGDHSHGHHHHEEGGTGEGESTGGNHAKNTIQFLSTQLKRGGFDNIEIMDAPPTDLLDQVHFLCKK